MRRKRMLLIGIVGAMAMLFAGCANNRSADAEEVRPQENQTAQQESTTTPDTATPNTDEIITEEEAKKIALEDAGLAESDVTNIRVQLGKDDGIWEYEVDFYAGNQEYDYDINAEDGAIRSKDMDIDDDFGKSAENNAGVSKEEAKKTALARVPGATDSDIRIHADYDDGKTIYEGSIIYNDREYDFEIDADSGAVIEWEEESVFDD